MNESIIYVNNPAQVGSAIVQATNLLNQRSWVDATGGNAGYQIEIKPIAGRTRSATQSNALHLWCEWVAVTLNSAGMDMRVILDEDADIPWTKQTVKDMLWKKLQLALTGKESTREPTKLEYPQIYETMVRYMADKHNVELPDWPKL